MDSRGGFGTVDLRDAINAGRVQGPRMQVVGQSLNQRATNYYPDTDSGRFYDGFTENKNINSPWLARAAVREAKLHGVDWVKIYTTQDFVGDRCICGSRTATLVNSPSLTLEEVEAIVDEAHRLGLKVACHTYGGEGMRSCIERRRRCAQSSARARRRRACRMLLQKKLPFVLTIDDLICAGDKPICATTGGRNSRLQAGRAGVQARARGRRADRVRQRRHVGAPSRTASRPISSPTT